MLLPAVAKTILLYGGLLLAGLGVLLFMVAHDAATKRAEQPLPEARLANAKDPSRIWKWLAPIMLFAGLGLAAASWLQTTDIIIVTDAGATLEATRKVKLFGSVDRPLPPGVKPYDRGNPTWVINESSRTVTVKEVTYGRSLGFGGKDITEIPSQTAMQFRRIDHVGPDDPPPRSVPDTVKLGMDWRYWLIW